MKLPVDNFQVLGVGPAASARTILMILQRKLDRCEFSGFSSETLRLRRELLSSFSKPLLDLEARKKLEVSYQQLDSEDDDARLVSVPDGYEVAGLLLLLECRLFEECFELVYHLNTDRSEYIIRHDKKDDDLSLIIGYATLEYGHELKSKRYYDSAARIFENGLAQLQDKVRYNNIQERIKEELAEITPYRILDLLSREMGEPVRDHGLQLLNKFVKERGGLDSTSNLYMKDDEFKSFFRQIRYFLTVQEQIDLYQHWSIAGSESACFLLGISLVADGFARRKPERLVESLEILKKIDTGELKDIVLYISLLLGKIEAVESVPGSLQNEDNYSSVESSQASLGQLCSGCRDWLESDVLEGYRDIDTDPDLEAYFSDRDVTSFIEKNDLLLGEKDTSDKSFFGPLGFSNRRLNRLGSEKERSQMKKTDYKYQSVGEIDQSKTKRKILMITYIKRLFIVAVALAGSLVIVYAFGWSKIQKEKSTKNSANRLTTLPIPSDAHYINKKLKDKKTTASQNDIQAIPGKSYISSILSKWLKIKAITLSGKDIPGDASIVATIEAIDRLKAERAEDMRRKQTQQIYAEIVNIDIITLGKDRIEINATLSYSDKRLGGNNRIMDSTPKHLFEKRYILVNRNSRWQVQ